MVAVAPVRSSKRSAGRAGRKFFDLARLDKTPIAIEVVKRIDALFAIEREINGLTIKERIRVRSRPLVYAPESWLREQRRALKPEQRRQSHRLLSHPRGCAHPLPRR